MQINLDEAKKILLYIINNNKRLQDSGQFPVSVSLCGGAGVGKTSMIDNLAKELDYNYVKLNLSQISDPSDLVGWPCKEHYACKGEECAWISSELINEYIKNGWTISEETRMGYAVPMWLKQLDPTKGSIVNLDDFSRCTPAIAQAVMEIICRQEYISWKLPKYTTLVMTENPDNGDFNVSSMDEALASRYMKFDIKFDVQSWARWAENSKIDGRVINFLLSYPEVMKENAQHRHPVNARNYVMFGNTISGIDDWEQSSNLAFIQQIASGAFLDDKDNIIGTLFTTFIANKLDKLVSPEDMLMKPWSTVKTQIKNCVYDDNGNYRPDVASVLHTRLLNYSLYYFEQKGAKTEVVQDRLLELIDAPDEVNAKGEKIGCMLFSEDFLFDIIRTLMKKFPTRTNKFMLNKKIRSKVM